VVASGSNRRWVRARHFRWSFQPVLSFKRPSLERAHSCRRQLGKFLRAYYAAQSAWSGLSVRCSGAFDRLTLCATCRLVQRNIGRGLAMPSLLNALGAQGWELADIGGARRQPVVGGPKNGVMLSCIVFSSGRSPIRSRKHNHSMTSRVWPVCALNIPQLAWSWWPREKAAVP
jgi:hypothetical protein